MRKKVGYTAIALSLASTTISAGANSPFSGMYTFGDSLFDTGQFGVRFTNRVGPDYQNSAFGPVSQDLVAQGVGLAVPTASRFGGTNYAVGSNRSIDTYDSITAETTYTQAYSIDNPPPDRDTTFNSLFYNLRSTGQRFDTNALYSLDGGGNDIGDALVFDEASAGVVATNMVNAATALTDRGAKYVVISYIPDFGLTPRGIDFGQFATDLAASVNRQIDAQIGGRNILVIDTFSMIQDIAADPASYGFSLSSEEISRSCFDRPDEANCAQGNDSAKINGSNPDPNQFLFNDPLHPTTLGQQISADFMLSILTAPAELALLPEMGMDDMRSHWRSAQPVMRTNRWNNNTEVGNYTIWGGLNANDNKRDTIYSDKSKNNATQYAVGFNYRFSDLWYLGGMLSRADNTLDFDSSTSEYEMQSLDFSVLTGFRGDHWFAEGLLSYSKLDYDKLSRSFSLGPVKRRTESGNTDGDSMGVLVNAGYNVFGPERAYRLGPMVGYEYIKVDVDGYSEDPGTATALNVDDQTARSGVFNFGAFGSVDLGFCDCELYSDLLYRKETRTDISEVRIGGVTIPNNMAYLPGYQRENDDSWAWNLGLAANFTPAVQLNLSGGGEQTDGASGLWYGAELSYTF